MTALLNQHLIKEWFGITLDKKYLTQYSLNPYDLNQTDC